MNQIAILQKRLDAATDELARMQAAAGPAPSFADTVFMNSLESQVEELRHDLRGAKELRGREVVLLQFEGANADGSLPLGLGTDMLGAFRNAVAHAAYFFQTGKHRVTRIPNAVRDGLGLRLRQLAPGSTKVYISGEINPDLFGESLLEQSLEATFDLLLSENEEDLSKAVSRVGANASSHIAVFLQKAQSIGYRKVSVQWETGTEESRIWNASRAGVMRLQKDLRDIKVEERTLTLLGRVVTLSLKGRVEIESGQQTYMCDFPRNLLQIVQPFRIGDKVAAKLTESRAINTVSGKEKVSYTLVTLRDPEAFERRGLDPLA